MARFWRRVQRTDSCWIWTGARNVTGYGHILVARRAVYAHRFSYELAYGPIPPGLEVDHLCHNPPCVRPDHLRAVSHRDNMRNLTPGKGHAAKTHCPRGHEYTPENTYVWKGRRNCRTCSRDSHRAWKRAHRDIVREQNRAYQARPEVRERHNEWQRRNRRMKGT